ncbi:helix-turn-helix domain-containing protein [Altererythrobacter xixiisoli]|uniref:Helix-turn-helix domain-containing protein n=1 Tax=Croceibacterium xixiisoli TaxID=1476466 RepID=A0A6I4U140_9SPHN|nr:Crp/Fnr family transcriptional regulator [Croceibacterium xixiisoli]MXP00589.1 helix-turn-helix domain-containing protein [Croceibacterium xixiisoli]
MALVVDTPVMAPMVRKLCLWQPLSDADKRAVLDLPHTLRSFDAGNYLVEEGDSRSDCCLLLSGYAFRQKVAGAGGRQILAMHIAGDVVDLQNSLLRRADHSVQALSAVQVALIPREAIVALAFSRPGVGLAMWYDTLVDGSLYREWMTNIGRRDARTRIAHLLCEFGSRLEAVGLGSTAGYEMPMTQEQIADATGLTTVHVNRILMGLDRQGLTQRTRRSVIIHDWDRLCDVGDFSRDYLHLD